ncbi:MAG: hypothetical protein M1837_000015 [Sclerophora amabilis]|nr:MAG: hypothetical protein M1837_000015 [Sclerophora amabilis]
MGSPRLLSVLLSVLYLFSQTTLAVPLLPRTQNCEAPAYESPASYELPLSHAPNATQLPAPSEGLVLKAVTLGRGTQNYTCLTDSATEAPVGNGAIAQLYNVSSLLAKHGQAYLNELGRDAVLTGAPTNVALTSPLPSTPLSGNHYFDAGAAPVFDLSCSNAGLLRGKKLATIPAPANAGLGQKGEPAVDWLKLGDAGGSVGVTEVYRVETAGGTAPKTCEGLSQEIQVQYTAQYWFYGPA